MNAPQEITDAQFFDMVDRFISQANEFGMQLPPARVSAALLFAAARFNAYNWASRIQLPGQSLDVAAEWFRAEYEKMFRDNARELGAARTDA